MLFLLSCHSVPHCIALLIAPNIIRLRARVEYKQVCSGDGNEHAVAATIAWRVICAVDVAVDDGAGLYEHVVEGGVDCAGSDGAGVARAPADLDGVHVWVAEEG